MRLSALLLVSLLALPVFGQQDQTAQQGRSDQGFYNPFTLASGLLQENFLNVYAYGNGAYDTNAQILSNGKIGGSPGYAVGGGIQLSHLWRTAQLGISYSGSYQHYNSNFFINGPTQNLTLGFTKQFSRRWILSLSEAAGIYLYGESYYSTLATNTTPVITNPFAPETRYTSSGISLTYRQTRRLSYVFGGSFSLYRYNGPGGIGADDAGASMGVNYQLTGRTAIGGSYSYSYFRYQHNAGNDNLNSIYGTVSHMFSRRWNGSISGGATHSDANGILTVPITILTGQQQTLIGYEVGAYHSVQWIPSVQATLTHLYRHSQVSINGGQGVSSGNGVFLASKNRYIGGIYSYDMRNSVFSVAAYYNRLSSISNTVSYDYSSGTFTVSYGHNLFKYVAANFRYDYIDYGGLGTYSGRHDNHFTFGLSFSSKSIPLTLF